MKKLTLTAFNTELPATPPEWIQLLPAGPDIVGHDGRRWRLSNAQSLVHQFAVRNQSIPVDWEHASEHRAPQGLPAPAAGWIDALELRNGAIWGRVEWTPTATNQISSREYRYLSPVFTYNQTTLEIRALKSVALTNQPNLNLTALNQFDQQQEDDAMNIAAILAALKLPADADINACVTAINSMQQALISSEARALNAEQKSMAISHDLSSYVPRADYDALQVRALNAEQALTNIQAQTLETDIETAINSALTAGKIVPATADYHRGVCRSDGGLERFKEFMNAAPVIAAPSGLDHQSPTATATALNAEERTAARLLGISAKDFIAAKAAEIEQTQED